MNTTMKVFSVSALLLLLSACGGSSGGESFTIGNGNPPDLEPGEVTIGISDAPVDDVKEVVIEIDRIIFRKSGEDDVVVDTFSSDDVTPPVVDADTIQINLLDFQGTNQAIVIEGLELEDGEYSNIILEILDEDLGNSYVVELDDTQKLIKVPSDKLQLGKFTVTGEVEQTFTIEFNLRQSLVYKPGPDEYNLKPRGVRIQNNSGDTSLSGTVASDLFDTESPCDEKTEPTSGNVVYLYEGHGLTVANLADMYDPDEDDDVPSSAIAPFIAEGLTESGGVWQYKFAFLPAGEYTLVFSCNAADDDPEIFDELELPLPEDQIIELTLTGGSGLTCNLPVSDDECGD
ncbi:DUF4382 domain-containing protein [Oceanicoccus sp. KOV_DT_Chl]|uniref:DUF4382 domain-containing protein n=1 Tax=Oceanicoccus sp. KOV_DT_Chl TaxID=1904639 RepID=UPI000C7C0B58|nr:DUF4382 domain-containing protein [Oceanicoccus sp. KOV_DT_Chl]